MDHSICHIEIPTTDLAKATKFYKELFGWKIEMWGESDYALFDTGKEPGGGIMKVDKVSPPKGMGITFYVLVDSIEDTLSKVAELGGKIVKEKRGIAEVPLMAGPRSFFARGGSRSAGQSLPMTKNFLDMSLTYTKLNNTNTRNADTSSICYILLGSPSPPPLTGFSTLPFPHGGERTVL
jgi:predicted enzyme related to lactoylglutathione lyase